MLSWRENRYEIVLYTHTHWATFITERKSFHTNNELLHPSSQLPWMCVYTTRWHWKCKRKCFSHVSELCIWCRYSNSGLANMRKLFIGIPHYQTPCSIGSMAWNVPYRPPSQKFVDVQPYGDIRRWIHGILLIYIVGAHIQQSYNWFLMEWHVTRRAPDMALGICRMIEYWTEE